MFKIVRNLIIAIGLLMVTLGSIDLLSMQTDIYHDICSFINILFLSTIYSYGSLTYEGSKRKPIINIRIFNDCDPKRRVTLEGIMTIYLIFFTLASAYSLMIKAIGFGLLAIATATDAIHHWSKRKVKTIE